MPRALAILALMPLAALAQPPRIERFTFVADEGAAIDGREWRLTTWAFPGRPHPTGTATLTNDAGATITVSTHGCARTGGFVYRLEAVDPGPAPWARFARAPVERTTVRARWDEEVVLSMGGRARTIDGWTIEPRSIEVRPDASVVAILVARNGNDEVLVEGYAPGGELGPERRFEERVARIRPRAERDALGCPTIGLVLAHPAVQIHDVRESQEVTLRRAERARMGPLTVRFLGWGERRVREGGDRSFASLEISEGGATSERMCFPPSCRTESHEIEIVEVTMSQVILRLRPRRSP